MIYNSVCMSMTSITIRMQIESAWHIDQLNQLNNAQPPATGRKKGKNNKPTHKESETTNMKGQNTEKSGSERGREQMRFYPPST